VKQNVLSAIRTAAGHGRGGGYRSRSGCPFGSCMLSCLCSDVFWHYFVSRNCK
jgi:hypothetical protein